MSRDVTKRITGKTEDGLEFSIIFMDDDYEEAISAYFEVESATRIIESINFFRRMSKEIAVGLFTPLSGKFKNQMEKLCIAAAASYPEVLSSDFIEKALNIPYNSYRVYATAKEHDSSRYLTLDDKKGISISLEGIRWLKVQLDEEDSTP